jgi:hypothetical protein
MRTLAYSPRHREKYLQLLANPLARLVDLLVIKQGEKITSRRSSPTSSTSPFPALYHFLDIASG